MRDIIDFLWLILISIVAFMLYRIYRDKKGFENFENSSDISSKVIKIYYDTLKRSPTSQELQKHTKEIFDKNYDYDELELRLVNSDEYQRLVKTQTDSILPETSRILEEKQVVDRIKKIYIKVRQVECPIRMYLPLKDLYIYFDYNVYKFVALLRDTKYSEFQREILQISNLSREKLIDIYHKTFDDSKLNYDASAMEEMDKSLAKGSRLIDFLLSEDTSTTDSSAKINAMAMLSYFNKNMKEDEERKKRLEEEEHARKMREASAELERQRRLAIKSTNDTSCDTKQRVYLPNESKILNTEHGFRVIQNLPPVCIPVGKPNELKEVIMTGGLTGTPLDEAQDTQVGSIMPKFEFRRYIEIDVKN
jgi:hypothetical protein